ncbi:MAG: radical SAM protein [Candidatus Thorarchaeota archaeon]
MTLTLTKIDELISKSFNLPEGELDQLFETAYNTSRKQFSNKMAFYAPGMVHYETEHHDATDPYRFPSISITGKSCSLNCEHCNTKLLEPMIPATTPNDLWKVFNDIKENNGSGCLISGGATPKGDTPLMKFIPTIKRGKENLGLDIVVHTGVVYPETAKALGEAGIDGAMFDIIGSNETLHQIYHLDESIDIFDQSMFHLEEYGVPYMPHIIAGLHYGQLTGEAEAIKMLARHNPNSVVVVAFMPLDNTPMQDVTPASPMDIARVVLATRLSIPEKPLILGCARPLGAHRRQTDKLAIDAGVNGIAYPSDEGYEYAEEKGFELSFANQCCSLIERVL